MDVGFLDEAGSADATGEALRVATEFAEGLDANAFATTRRRTCAGLGEAITRN